MYNKETYWEKYHSIDTETNITNWSVIKRGMAKIVSCKLSSNLPRKCNWHIFDTLVKRNLWFFNMLQYSVGSKITNTNCALQDNDIS